MKELIIKNNVVVLLDDSDYDWCISQGKWWYDIRKQKSGELYFQVKNQNGFLHRQLLNVTDAKIQVDHIDHNPLNNQRNNLRLCTQQQNCLNTRKRFNASSKFKGVCWNKRDQKWVVGCQVNGRPKHLGYFTSELEAAKVYDNFVKQLPDAEFRVLNFPDAQSA